jgi:quinol monooxygenase YgiN
MQSTGALRWPVQPRIECSFCKEGSRSGAEMIIQRMRTYAPRRGKLQMGRALASLTRPTEVQPGCLNCRLLQNWHASNELLVETDWRSKEDLIRHLQSDAYKRILLFLELSPKPPILEFYTVQEVSGIELVKEARNPDTRSSD